MYCLTLKFVYAIIVLQYILNNGGIMKKKILSVLLCFLITVLPAITTGCGNQSADDTKDPQKVTESDADKGEDNGDGDKKDESAKDTEKDDGKFSKGLNFTLSEDKKSYIVVDMGSCTDKNISVPDTYEGLPVSGIAPNAFKNATTLEKVVLPESITVIGDNSFSGCILLAEITIGSKVVSIGNGAFEGCSSLGDIQLSVSLKLIGENAFKGCIKLIKVFLPEDVEQIGANAFASCDSLTDIVVQSKDVPSGLDTAVDKDKTTVTVDHKQHTIVNCEAKAATCTEQGWDAYEYCSVCDYSTLKYIAPNGHDYGEWITEIPAECESNGTLGHYHCDECGKNFDINKIELLSLIIETNGHNTVTDKAVEPTCTETGLTEGSHCTECGTVFIEQTVVDALGHDEYTYTGTEPTCTEGGWSDSVYCNRCYQYVVESEYIEPKGHSEVIDVEGKAPTCTEAGYTASSHCSVCTTTLSWQETLPAAHIVENGACINCFKAYDVWDGSYDTSWYNDTDKEFVLTTAEQLAGFMQLVNGGNTFEGITVKLGVNLEMSDMSWTPIGKLDTTAFNGTFDGQNYTVCHFSISAANSYVGFFGYNMGTVKNLCVDARTTGYKYTGLVVGYNKGTVSGCSAVGTISGGTYVGGLVGYNDSVIDNCSADVDVTLYGQSAYVGGLVGYMNSNSSVSNSYASGSLQADISYKSGMSAVGGLIGYSYTNAVVNSCYATGTVTSGNATTCPANAYAGGLVGYSYKITVTDSYATGEVRSNGQTSYAGGLVAYLSGTVSNCYATGTVYAYSSNAKAYAGGISGFAGGSVIEKSHATNAVSGYTKASNGETYVGGLLGYGGANIDKCYFSGSISNYSSWSYIGGIVGYNTTDNTVSNSYCTGDITGSANASTYVGGIAGENFGIVTKCYSSGTVTSSNSADSANAGGIVGLNASGATVSYCYSVATVVAKNSGYSGRAYVGGVVAVSDGTVTKCYRSSEQSITVEAVKTTETNSAGTSKSISEILTASFHTSTLGWSADIWNLGTELPTLK